VERRAAPHHVRVRVPILLTLLLSAVASARSAPADTIRVGAAISLKDALTEIAADYEKRTGDRVEFPFGSSGQVMAQVNGGAPLDAFISAADKQVDALAARGLVDPESRRVVAGNTLVLIVARDADRSIDSFEALGSGAVSRMAIGEPKTVPAGEYAAQVLAKLKLKDAVAGRLVYGSNVRQVLNYVARGEVTAGVVYATDARQAGDKVKVVATASENWHDPIVYTAVLVKKSRNAAAARRFLDHLATDDARRVLRARGFTIPPAPSEPAKPADRRS
jgi:molybdate transport system substrate-binding protein